MDDLKAIVNDLRLKLDNTNSKEGKVLEQLNEKLKGGTDWHISFENSWVGGWGRQDVNHYHNLPGHPGQTCEINDNFLIDLIEKKCRIDIDDIIRKLDANILKYKKLKTEIVTELSIIKDDESFKQEAELLNTIEHYQWGISESDYIKMKRPNQIPIYDMHILSRGLEIPPHIKLAAMLLSIGTKAVSVKSFSEIALRLLRQVEIKISRTQTMGAEAPSGQIIGNILEKFHYCARQLRNRHSNRNTIVINDEYDVQDLLHALLKLHFEDVREEEYTPSYAGSSTRMDFLLKNEQTVIEVKKTRERLTDKEIGEQLILDVAHYKNHPNCNKLVCFVYDPESRVSNPKGLERDIAKLSDDNLLVEIYIRP